MKHLMFILIITLLASCNKEKVKVISSMQEVAGVNAPPQIFNYSHEDIWNLTEFNICTNEDVAIHLDLY